MTDPTKVTLNITAEQADAVNAALDFYARICIGQIEELAALTRFGVLAPRAEPDQPRPQVSPETAERIHALANMIKDDLGHPHNGSYGIGHNHVHASAKRAWEVKKSITQALAIARNPAPEFKGPAYDGNFVRYTDDPEPETIITIAPSAPSP
jgi:hypothetical protein